MAGECEVCARWAGGRRFVGIDEGGRVIAIDASVEGGGRRQG
jgi:hypothetical protein